jgi:hypothetical protein
MGRILNFFFGITSIGSDTDDSGVIPTEFSLLPAYPNPFNPQTNIEYQLPEASKVTLEVYNTLGQKVRTLINGHNNAGRYHVIWNGHDETNNPAASGVYLIRFHARAKNSSISYQETRKIVLIK